MVKGSFRNFLYTVHLFIRLPMSNGRGCISQRVCVCIYIFACSFEIQFWFQNLVLSL